VPILQDLFAGRPVGEWMERLSARGVPCAPVNDIGAALAEPQAREVLVAHDHPVLGEVRTIANPVRLDASSRPPGRGPFLGEHTVEILTDVCGYSGDRIEELAALGIFGPIAAQADKSI
jgi:crotonobetainyl-CoA:carnitine CoA-transferase CaiB-like acyl-CoA transferase